MATRFDTMIQRLAEVRAMDIYDDPSMVAMGDQPSWLRGMIKEGWVEERGIGTRGTEDYIPAWYVTPAWHALVSAHESITRPVGRPRMARLRCVTFALLCPRCSTELVRGNEAETPKGPLQCVCGAESAVPARAIDALCGAG